jgi:2-keto-3-deoxy-6-phosphogluconate aldolase
MRDGTDRYLSRCDLIAILRGIRPEPAVAITAALATHDVAILEVPLRCRE